MSRKMSGDVSSWPGSCPEMSLVVRVVVQRYPERCQEMSGDVSSCPESCP
jgi:hypothetical protein